jgi:hypothetical protein
VGVELGKLELVVSRPDHDINRVRVQLLSAHVSSLVFFAHLAKPEFNVSSHEQSANFKPYPLCFIEPEVVSSHDLLGLHVLWVPEDRVVVVYLVFVLFDLFGQCKWELLTFTLGQPFVRSQIVGAS